MLLSDPDSAVFISLYCKNMIKVSAETLTTHNCRCLLMLGGAVRLQQKWELTHCFRTIWKDRWLEIAYLLRGALTRPSEICCPWSVNHNQEIHLIKKWVQTSQSSNPSEVTLKQCYCRESANSSLIYLRKPWTWVFSLWSAWAGSLLLEDIKNVPHIFSSFPHFNEAQVKCFISLMSPRVFQPSAQLCHRKHLKLRLVSCIREKLFETKLWLLWWNRVKWQ